MLSPAELRERYDRIRAEVGPGVTVVAATKYVALADFGVLAEAGIEVVGENRVQDLEAKHAEYGDAFRWHFIGRLQSNKVKPVNRICELVHSLDSHSAAQRLEVPALVQVNLAGEESKGGIAPAELAALPRRSACAACRRCRRRPPTRRPRGRGSAGCASSRRSTAWRELSMGTTQDYRVAAEEGATYVRVGSVLFRDGDMSHAVSGRLWTKCHKIVAKDIWRPGPRRVSVALEGGGAAPPGRGRHRAETAMSGADLSISGRSFGTVERCVHLPERALRSRMHEPWDQWNKMLVYFGIAEENEEWYDDDEGHTAEESLEQSYRDRPNVRRLTPRRRSQEYDDWTDSEADAPRRRRPRAPRRRPRARAASSRRCRTRTRCASTSSCRAASTTRSRSPTASSSRSR